MIDLMGRQRHVFNFGVIFVFRSRTWQTEKANREGKSTHDGGDVHRCLPLFGYGKNEL